MVGYQKVSKSHRAGYKLPNSRQTNGIYRDKNSSGDEIVNVNFFYDDTLHALQNIVHC